MVTTGSTIGERIRELRNGWMTQQELATAAGVSVDLVRKLEQGIRHTCSVSSLARLARALDVDMAALLAKPTPPPTTEPDSGLIAIRRVLTSVEDLTGGGHDVEPASLIEAERTVDYLWGSYWSGRYELLASLLPAALTTLRATYRDAKTAEKPQAAHILARAYQAAGDTLVHMGQTDAAFLAIREALVAAKNSDDPLLYAAMRMSVSWQMLVQGRYDDSANVALAAANEISPRGKVSNSQLSAYGILTVTAATATARKLDKASTVDLLAESRQAANRIGYDRSEHQTTFGPAKVAMLSVDCAVVMDNFTGALAAAQQLPRDAHLPLATKARHLADVSLSHLRLGHDKKALDTLLSTESFASDWLKYQSLPRQITSELLERENRKSTRLREFATRIGATRSS
ncbi:helix-turn-helix domain-containing protein [Amycolatopsis sp. cmx-8-4]|uniref:helix-turn-helix domain-containing protein n=1 Tax=Amycolatopsis sp. cmx-8-4 TaxID=2790947 RepID=UPI00397ABFC2